MKDFTKASLDAFNVSKNCDRTSVQSFYDSYTERKKKIIVGKLAAYKDGKPINKKKLQWEILCLRTAKEQKEEVLRYIKTLLDSVTSGLNQDLINEAEELTTGGLFDEN